MEQRSRITSVLQTPVTGLLTWILPGLGHLYLGQRVRGWVLMMTMTLTFWTGIAVGGVHGTIDPKGHTLWFMAQLCNGGHTAAALFLRAVTTSKADVEARAARPADDSRPMTPYYGPWMAVELGTVYTAVVGLLNLLVISDVMARSEAGARPPPGGAPS